MESLKRDARVQRCDDLQNSSSFSYSQKHFLLNYCWKKWKWKHESVINFYARIDYGSS